MAKATIVENRPTYDEAKVNQHTFDIKMSIDQINSLLGILSKAPYEQSAGFISFIHGQTLDQLKQFEISPEPPKE